LPGFRVTSMECYLEEKYEKNTITPEIRAALDAAQ
jgi:hypothetical protein